VRQDEDILDTWFSSALLAVLGRSAGPTRPARSRRSIRTTCSSPARHHLLWVARMMMMGIHFMGKVPFKTVYLTSIVTDENGDKMSKTKGT